MRKLKNRNRGSLQVSDDLLHFGVVVNKISNQMPLPSLAKPTAACHCGCRAGNPNRLVSTQQAVEKTNENGHTDLKSALLVSDDSSHSDNIDAANAGVTQVVKPGSIAMKKSLRLCWDGHGCHRPTTLLDTKRGRWHAETTDIQRCRCGH